MNTRKQWTKWVWVTLIVVLASVVSTGLVLADHEVPLIGAGVNSRTYFEQYLAAIDHMESNRDAAIANTLNRANTGSRVRFEQYNAALSQMERERIAGFVAAPVNITSSRDVYNTPPAAADQSGWKSFEQYLAAQEMVERERDAALEAPLISTEVSSRDAFEQYLAALEQMDRDHNAALLTSLDSESSRVRFEQYLEYAK